VDEHSAVWHSIDGDWSVSAISARDGQFYRVGHRGELLAELDSFIELAHLVPLHLLVAEGHDAR
jgi:hypothetical protein